MTQAVRFRDYAFLGTTQSVCPDCLAVVPAKIVARGQRVYFRKRCPQHGEREDFVCSDVAYFDQLEYSLPGKLPARFGVEPRRGCPYDCGLCDEHEQHTCVGILEITSSCNLECPLCYAASGPLGTHLSVADCEAAMDALIATEGRPEVLQLSGGEPTVHPDFLEIFSAACARPIDIVMINTNGIRFARDEAFLERVAAQRHRCEIYLQFDGFRDSAYRTLRGEPLVEMKLRAIERLGAMGLRVILVCTVEAGVNDDELGAIVQFGRDRSWITGVSFQPATYVGRYPPVEQLERRVTFPDILKGIVRQSADWANGDFAPLPCAHPNAHSLAYAYRAQGELLPLARFIHIKDNLDLLANGITFTRQQASNLMQQYLNRAACGSDCGCGPAFSSLLPVGAAAPTPLSARDAPDGTTHMAPSQLRLAEQFLSRALQQDLGPEDMFRITTTSFMDAFNFDVRQLMKSCVHHVLPSGHLIPFSAYNLFYRPGRIPLPPLRPRPERSAPDRHSHATGTSSIP